jgi:ferric-dicitrate binding protein FerR (iron transport regulator)
MKNFFASSRRRRLLMHLALILLTAMLVALPRWTAPSLPESGIGAVE